MPVNVFSAGRDALLEELGRRDAARLREQMLARQSQLDEEQRQFRQAQLGNEQARLTMAQQDRERAANADLAAQGAVQEQNMLRQRLLSVLDDPRASDELKSQARRRLMVEFKAPEGAVTDPQGPKMVPVYARRPDGTVVQVGTVPEDAKFTDVDRPPAGATLSPQVKDYLASLRSQVPDKQAARDLVSRNADMMREKGEPVPDMAAVFAYLDDVFPAAPALPGQPPQFPGTAPPSLSASTPDVPPPSPEELQILESAGIPANAVTPAVLLELRRQQAEGAQAAPTSTPGDRIVATPSVMGTIGQARRTR